MSFRHLVQLILAASITMHLHGQDSIASMNKSTPVLKVTEYPNAKQLKQNADSLFSTQTLSRVYQNSFRNLYDSSAYSIQWPSLSLPKLNARRPLQLTGGNTTYNYDYRSNIDTPFTDKNVSQHQLTGQLNVTAFQSIPLQVTFFIRRTNSSLFRDINDVRVDFDANQYAQLIRDNYLKKLSGRLPGMRDSLLNQLKRFNLSELGKIMNRISRPDFQQKLVECNEIVRVPGIAESIAGSGKADSLRQDASKFIETYQLLKAREGSYRQKADSIQGLINSSIAKGQMIRQALNGHLSTISSPDQVITLLRQQGIRVPASVRHLLSLRRFSLGRSQLNYSELTARNISLNGINIEYNSWYYIALAAGTVNYRFRDFILTRSNRKPQYMYLARLGVGRLERNYIIATAYRGQKQAYIQNNSSSGASSSLDIYGLSLEAKYRLNRNIYIITEMAQSGTPGRILIEGQKINNFFNWRDRSNKGYAIKFFSYFPQTRTRFEGMYRFSGAAFQSFDRFQSNSSRESWYVKGEQTLWKRQLKFTASLRKNEFTNPYVIVPYSNRVVSKSIQVSFRRRRWPMLTAGLMPFSQLSVVNDQVYENRFHALNAVLYHQYKVGGRLTSTTATYNRFYNTAADTGFVYFNAVNFYLQQYLFFQKFTLSAGGSHSRNTGFEINVLETSLQVTLHKDYSVTGGLKINNYNRMETKIGYWSRISMRFMKTGWLQLNYENGLLPGNSGSLLRNQWGNVMLTKFFN
jgi:hypothetical protein